MRPDFFGSFASQHSCTAPAGTKEQESKKKDE